MRFVYRLPPLIRLRHQYIFSSAVAVSWEQEGFRFRNDDGSEITATWRQVQDVNDTASIGDTIRPRILSDATGDPSGTTATLQYKRDDEPAAEWRDI